MNEPTDINLYRQQQRIEQCPVFYIDGKGVRWCPYVIEYTDDAGDLFGITLWATSFRDASARIKAIGERGEVLGVLHAEIPLG